MRTHTRFIRVIVLVILLLALLPLAGADADLTPQAGTRLAGDPHLASVPNNMTEDFEGTWPATGWTVWDAYTPSVVVPDARDCQALGGSKSLMMHGGGTAGAVTGCLANYPLDFLCRAWYGPFDLSTATAAEFSFAFTGTMEIQYYGDCGDYDYFLYGVSTNEWDINGTCLSGEWDSADPSVWNERTVDLTPYLGESQVWIGFEFRSDYSDTARGIYIDNVTLTTTEAAATATPTSTLAPTETATVTYTPDGTVAVEPTNTVTPTQESTATSTASATIEASPTATATQAATPSATDTPGAYPSPTTGATVDPYPSPATDTPTATATCTPTPTSSATLLLPLVIKGGATGAYSELMANGGFETQDAWVLPITVWTAVYAADEAHAGARSALVGIADEADNVFSYSSAYQWVTLPADAVDAELTFWTYAHSGEPRLVSMPSALKSATTLGEMRQALASTGSDLQYVVLRRQGQPMVKLLAQCDDSTGWTQHTFDVSQFAGESIAIHFEVYNDGEGGVTSMHVDDVSLMVR